MSRDREGRKKKSATRCLTWTHDKEDAAQSKYFDNRLKFSPRQTSAPYHESPQYSAVAVEGRESGRSSLQTSIFLKKSVYTKYKYIL